MNEQSARNLFALLCALAAIAVAGGALLEAIRYVHARRENRPSFSGDLTAPSTQGNEETALVSPRQSKLRLLSSLMWVFVLALLALAVTKWWPNPGNKEEARRFLTAIAASLLLIFAALALLVYDVIQIARARARQEVQHSAELAAMLRDEARKIREKRGSEDSPSGAGE